MSDELRTENNELHELNFRLAKLLEGVANALRGAPAPNTAHSFHDLPELALAVVEDGRRLREALALAADIAFYSGSRDAEPDVALKVGMAMGAHDKLFMELRRDETKRTR